MRFIAIGNGTSITDHKLGKTIDSDFDVVIRFNRGYLEAMDNYTDYVGTKTDILIIHDGYCKPEYLTENILTSIPNILVGIPKFKFMIEAYRIMSYGFGDTVKLIPMSIEDEIREIVDFESSWPSTGLLGIKYLCNALTNNDTLTLFGFDGWNKKYEYYHYFDKNEDRVTEMVWKGKKMPHKLGLEVEAMNFLRNKYDLKELVDD